MLEFLHSIDPSQSEEQILAALVLGLSHLPEQSSERWKQKLLRPRKKLMVGREDVISLIEGWLANKTYVDLFLELPAVQRSSRNPRADAWSRGSTGEENWSEEFDKFLDFVAAVVERFLPWLLHACVQLASHAGGNATHIDWETLKVRVDARTAQSDIGETQAAPG